MEDRDVESDGVFEVGRSKERGAIKEQALSLPKAATSDL